MKLTVESIRKMLSEITQGKWTVFHGKCFEITSDKGEILCGVPEYSQGHVDAGFIATSPEIVRFLLDRVEELDRANIKLGKQYIDRGFEIKDLELRFQAANNLLQQAYLYNFGIQPKPIDEVVNDEIEKEFRRLKEAIDYGFPY